VWLTKIPLMGEFIGTNTHFLLLLEARLVQC
jgi:hypothetical protein